MISIIIPTLDEEETLGKVLTDVSPYADEIIVVDGFSRDTTPEIARQFKKVKLFQVIGEKGSALRYGFEKAEGDIVVTMDADGSHRVSELPQITDAIKNGAEVCMPSRFLPGGGSADMPGRRVFGNWVFCTMVNVLFGTKYTDLCYGYRAFRKDVVSKLKLKADGFETETEMSIHAVKAKLKVVEVPSFEELRQGGVGKLRSLPDGWRILKQIVKEIFIKI